MRRECIVEPELDAVPGRGWLAHVGVVLQRVWRGVKRPGLSGRLRVVERLNVGPRQSLLVVVCRGRRLLLASAADSLQLIAELKPSRTRSRGSLRRAR